MEYFTQANKDKGHAMLDALIDMTREAAIECCKAGLDAQRDALYDGLSKLYSAKSILGGVEGPEVSTRSGEK
jgi:hypothetical protein